jgi:hypothetical protein
VAVFAAQVSADADAMTLFTVARVAELQPLPAVEKEFGHRPVTPTSSKVACLGNGIVLTTHSARCAER